MEIVKYHTLEEVFAFFKQYNKDFDIDYNVKKTNEIEIKCNVTFSQDNFKKRYKVKERTYVITNRSGKRFFNMPSCSRSVFMNSLDGTDNGVRYDFYNWKVDRVKLFIPDKLVEYYPKTAVYLDFDTWLERQPKGTFVQGGGV